MPRRGQTNRQSLDQRSNAGKPKNFPRRQKAAQDSSHIDASVREFILNIPAFRQLCCVFYQAEEAFAEYANAAHSRLSPNY